MAVAINEDADDDCQYRERTSNTRFQERGGNEVNQDSDLQNQEQHDQIEQHEDGGSADGIDNAGNGKRHLVESYSEPYE